MRHVVLQVQRPGGRGTGEHPLQHPEQRRSVPAGTPGDGRCATALHLRVQEETGGDSGSAAHFQSSLAGACENFPVREKGTVFSGFAGGRPAPACAQQLGAAAGFGHGAGRRGLRHGGDAAAESAAHDFNAQPSGTGRHPRPRGSRRGCRGDQDVSGQV